MLFEVIFYY